jgi:LytR cell envelope-related transcriptional attenuator
MPELQDLLQRAAHQPTSRPNVDILWRSGRQRRRRRRAINAMVGLACLVTFGGTLAFISDGNDRQTLDVIAPSETNQPTTTMEPSSTTTSPPSSAAPTTDRLLNAASGSTRTVDQIAISVMNGAGICGVATNYRPYVKAVGYQRVSAENAPTIVSTSTIFFLDGYAPDAAVLATRLHMPISATIDAQTAAWLERVGANIGVVLGQDALSYVAKPDVCGGSGDLVSDATTPPTTT